MIDDDLPVWQQPLLRYFVSACGAVLAFIAIVNLAGGFGDFVTDGKQSSPRARLIPTMATSPSPPHQNEPPIHNVYYLVESEEHAQALISGAEAMPPSLDPNPTNRIVLIAPTENEATLYNIELFSESFEQQVAGNSFTYELITVRR